MNNYIIIIRSVGERTEELCEKLIVDQGVDKKDVEIIRETPFSKALEVSFEIGIKRKKKWTFMVDADVLLRENSVNKMIQFAEAQDSNICQIQGYILDKFFGGIRRGGVHIYRTELLPLALKMIPDEGTNVRPESFLLREMEKNGYPHKVEPYVVGTHDDEQYNFDIYRKAFVQAVKHTARAELFIKLWRSKSDFDQDFKIALKGFSDSLLNHDEIYINKDLSIFREKFNEAGFSEKEKIEKSSYSPKKIDEIINQWIYPDIYYKFFPDKDKYETKNFLSKGKIKNLGFKKSLYLGISKILLNTGYAVKRKSKLV